MAGLAITDGFPHQRMVVLPRPIVAAEVRRTITASVLPTDIGFFPTASSHLIRRESGSPQAIVILCVRGEGWAEVAGQPVKISEGQVLLIPAGRAHAYGAARYHPWTIYWCHLAGQMVGPLLATLGVTGEGRVVHGQPQILVPLFERMLQLLSDSYSRPALISCSLAAGHLLGELISHQAAGPVQTGVDERLSRSVEFMKSRIGSTIRVSELASMCSLSPSHFAALFKAKYGYPALDYFIRLKIQEAARRLDFTIEPINTIANRLGYEDPLYFSRAFRRVMGISPRTYRELKKG